MITAKEAKNITKLGIDKKYKEQKEGICKMIRDFADSGVTSYHYGVTFGFLDSRLIEELKSNGFEVQQYYLDKYASKISWE